MRYQKTSNGLLDKQMEHGKNPIHWDGWLSMAMEKTNMHLALPWTTLLVQAQSKLKPIRLNYSCQNGDP